MIFEFEFDLMDDDIDYFVIDVESELKENKEEIIKEYYITIAFTIFEDGKYRNFEKNYILENFDDFDLFVDRVIDDFFNFLRSKRLT